MRAHKKNQTDYICETCQFGFSSQKCLKFVFDKIYFIFRAHQAAKRCLTLYATGNDPYESALDSGQTQYSADEDMQDEIEIMIETD